MELVGRIDRVDQAQDSNGCYLRIIDYKSSERDLNLSEVYYGLSLQMLTYLDLVITHSPQLIGAKASPAGILYFHVHNPIVQASKMLTLEEIEREIFKSFKMNGLMLGDQNVIQLMDQTIEGDSLIIPAGFKKDGDLKAYSRVVNKNEFECLTNYVRSTYEKSGNQMVEGIVDISPYKMKNKTPCGFCSFKSICQFDQSILTNEYRNLPPKSKEEVLTLIQEGVE
jgi:ATP-dependent helicase/nuclease subunit B